MAYELCYTSVPQGLRPGTSGFCTVGLTRGTPAALVERLESLSGYRPLFPASDPRAAQNPVAWAHWRLQAGAQSFDVLSRVCFAGLDHTQRSNKFAHHVALAVAELPAGGPAWAVSEPGVMRRAWSGTPTEYERGPLAPAGDLPAGPCAAWAAECDDPGWAGALAESFLAHPARPAYLIYPPGVDALALVREALALVPARQRWQVTFNTYFTDLPAGSACAWRCCAAGSPAAEEARHAGGLVIDLTAPLSAAPDSQLAQVARGVASAAAAYSPVGGSMAAVVSPLQAADDDDGYPDPTPRALAVAPAARFGGGPSGVVGGRPTAGGRAAGKPAAAPDSWMPPLNSTVVERPGGGRPGGGGSAVRTVAAAVAGAVLAAGGTYAVDRAAAGRAHLADVQAKQDVEKQLATAQQQADDVRKEFDQFKTRSAADIETARAAGHEAGRQEPDPTVWQRVGTAAPSAKPAITEADVDAKVKAAVEAERRKLHAELAGGPPVAPVVAKANARAPAGTDELPLKPLHLPPIAGLQPYQFQLDDLPPSADSLLVGKLKAGTRGPSCTLTPAQEGPSLFRVEPAAGGGVLVFRTKQGLGAERLDLFALSAAGNEVRLKWPAVSEADDKARRDFLRTCMLTVKDETGGTGLVQFGPAEVFELTLSEQDRVALPLVRLATAKLAVLPDTPAPLPAWKVKDSNANSILYTELTPTAAGSPTVKLWLTDGLLNCNFSGVYKQRQTSAFQLQKEADDLAANAKLVKGQLDWSAAPFKQVEYEKKKEELAVAKGAIKSMQSFQSGTAVVQLRNGVVLYQVNLVTSLPRS